jgi:hypothetical protein
MTKGKRRLSQAWGRCKWQYEMPIDILHITAAFFVQIPDNGLYSFETSHDDKHLKPRSRPKRRPLNFRRTHPLRCLFHLPADTINVGYYPDGHGQLDCVSFSPPATPGALSQLCTARSLSIPFMKRMPCRACCHSKTTRCCS